MTDVESLRELPNVHRLGLKPYSALPHYARGFDVGIIPFRTNELTVRANPLKLREYLAAGLPVVATPLPEMARYDGLVYLADGRDAYIAQIEAALRERTETSAQRRVDAMQPEGWNTQVAEISVLVSRHLEQRSWRQSAVTL